MNIEKEINEIKLRNKRVEADKKWETSWTRRVWIMILTFLVVLVYNFVVTSQDSIILNSAVPVIGFFLSTVSLDLIRKKWEK